MTEHPTVWFIIKGDVVPGKLLEKGPASEIAKVACAGETHFVQPVFANELDAQLFLLEFQLDKLRVIETRIISAVGRIHQLRHEEVPGPKKPG